MSSLVVTHLSFVVKEDKEDIFFVVEFFIHTTHTTKAERMAEKSPRRPRRRRVARRPSATSREKNPAAAGIRMFFYLEQRVEKKDIGPRRSGSHRCPPPVVVVAKPLFHHTKLPPRGAVARDHRTLGIRNRVNLVSIFVEPPRRTVPPALE